MTKLEKTPASPPEGEDRLIRYDELKTMVPLSIATINRYCREGIFPGKAHLSQRCTAWRLSEVRAYVAGTWEPNTSAGAEWPRESADD